MKACRVVGKKMGSVMRGGIKPTSSDWQKKKKPAGRVHQRGMRACVCACACVKEVPRKKRGEGGGEGGSVKRLVYCNCKPPQTPFIPPALLYIITSHYHHQQSSCATDPKLLVSSSPSLCPAPNLFLFFFSPPLNIFPPSPHASYVQGRSCAVFAQQIYQDGSQSEV